MRVLTRLVVSCSQAFFAGIVLFGSPISFAQIIKLDCPAEGFLLNIDTARKTVGYGDKTDTWSLSEVYDKNPGTTKCVNQIYEWNDARISWGRKCSRDGGPFEQITTDKIERSSGMYRSWNKYSGDREFQCKLFDPTKKLF